MKKILVSGYYDQNLGDDLFFKILFDRYPNANYTLLTEDRRYNKIFKSYKNVSTQLTNFDRIMRRLKLANKPFKLDDYKEYDAFVIIGGSIFLQWENWRQDFTLRKDIINYFKKNNKKVFILGANFGPYEDEEFFKEYNNLFKLCDDICFRDKYTYDMFNHLENVRISPDIVFNLDDIRVKKIKNSIGISIINLKNRKELCKYSEIYYKKISEIIKLYIDKKYSITMFSFCERQGDLEAINEVIKYLDISYKNNIDIINYDGNIDLFINKFATMENIIGSRFHSVILSQIFKQGIYPLIYSDKTYNVLNDLDLVQNYTYISNLEELTAEEVYKNIKNNKINSELVMNNSQNQFLKLDRYMMSK